MVSPLLESMQRRGLTAQRDSGAAGQDSSADHAAIICTRDTRFQHRNAFLTNFDKRSWPDDKIVWSEKSAFLSFFAPAEPSPLDADGRSMYP